MIYRKFKLLCFVLSRGGTPREIVRALTQDRAISYRAMDLEPFLPQKAEWVVDVGAHEGDFAAAVNWLLEPLQMVLIEPQPGLASRLQERFSGSRGITVVEACAGESGGKARFQVHDFSAASSLYDCRPGHLASLDITEGRHAIEVSILPLEKILAPWGDAPIDLLKLDCQGGELAALRGLGSALGRVKHILCEVQFEPLYADTPLFGDIHAFLLASGFELIHLGGFSGVGSTIQWSDAVYVRAHHANRA